MTSNQLVEIQNNILTNISTLNHFNQYLLFSVDTRASHLLSNPIYNLVQSITTETILLNIVKLLEPYESFSFNKIFSLNPFEDSSIKKTIDKDEFRRLRKDLKKIQAEYKDLNIKNIRDEYLAHMDESGFKYRLTSSQIMHLVDKLEEFFNAILIALFDQTYEYKKLDKEIDKLLRIILQHQWITTGIRNGIRDKVEKIDLQNLRQIYRIIK
jgi:hypothetical protein